MCGFTFQDNLEVMLVSSPGGDQSKYNDVFLACFQDRIGFAVVWEAYFGPSWILVWLRGVLLAVLRGAVPLVLTGAPDISGKKVPGNLGFAQRGEVSLLVALGIQIKHVDIDEFIANRRPNHVFGQQKQWPRLQEVSTNPPARKDFLYKLEREAPSQIISQLLDLHPNLSLRDDQGFTVLHHAALSSNSSAVDLLINIPECNVNKKDFEGHSPLSFALLQGHTDIIQSLRDKQAVLTGYEVAVLARAGVAL
ncbi:unnamed protein product [Pseudo-nitzschia multistriata]|uniref:Uncharacterized protein n=1 Tax=Pseudo-nitzschia multistriata TaxID=183589 RepID=A0A448ZBL3_9STRA|nr:unnamed protein product [Pseudo-nitzschia multistriata]